MDNITAISALDNWFKERCDGTPEHHYVGITIETTNSRGWLLTFKKLENSEDIFVDIVGDLLRKHNAQVKADGMSVFATSLQDVLAVTALLIEKSSRNSGGCSMSLNKEVNSTIAVLERWFQKHCDGTWEQHLGIFIQTTDNPGWLFNFKELKISKGVIADMIGGLLRDYDAQVWMDLMTVRVFGPSLQQVLLAAAILAERSDSCSETGGISQQPSDIDDNSHA